MTVGLAPSALARDTSIEPRRPALQLSAWQHFSDLMEESPWSLEPTWVVSSSGCRQHLGIFVQLLSNFCFHRLAGGSPYLSQSFVWGVSTWVGKYLHVAAFTVLGPASVRHGTPLIAPLPASPLQPPFAKKAQFLTSASGGALSHHPELMERALVKTLRDPKEIYHPLTLQS